MLSLLRWDASVRDAWGGGCFSPPIVYTPDATFATERATFGLPMN